MDGESKTDKKTKNPKKKVILSAVLSFLAAVYILYHIFSGFAKETQLHTVTYSEFDDAEVFTGYIFRDDTALLSSANGTVDIHYSDGEKVPANSVIADVYSVLSEEIGERLTEIGRETKILRDSALTGTETLASIDSQIAQLRVDMAQKTDDGDLVWVSAHGDELAVLINRRELLASGNTDYSEKIASLDAERNELLRSLGRVAYQVTTTESGYFFSYCDGREGKLTCEKALTVTSENYDEITSVASVSLSNAIGALMTDFRWYFVCKTDIDSSEGYTIGTYYKCTFLGNACSDVLEMKLEDKSVDYSGGVAVLRFSSSYIPAGFDMTRNVSVRALRATISGLRVPVSAVRVVDGQTCVYIFKKGIARLREINILYERDGCYLVDGNTSGTYASILQNDLVIIDDTNLYDGKIVG